MGKHLPGPQSPTEQNIRTIAAIETEALNRRSSVQRIADTVATEAGQPWSVVAHLIWFVVWIVLNASMVPGVKPFDPFPYPFLTMIVSLESIFLCLFMLMSENRSSRQAEQRAHLDLQINLLAESENTKMLQMLQALCAHHGLAVAHDPQVEQLAGVTEATQVLAEIQKHLRGR